MILFKDIIEKQLGMLDEYKRRRYYIRAYSVLGSLINLSLIILNKTLDREKEIARNRLWRKLLLRSIENKGLSDKLRFKMELYFAKDLIIVSRALNFINETIETSDAYDSDIHNSKAILIDTMEYPGTDHMSD